MNIKFVKSSMSDKKYNSQKSLSQILNQATEDDDNQKSLGELCQDVVIKVKQHYQNQNLQINSSFSDASSICSRLTINEDRIQFKVNIIANKKYQIIGDKHQLITQTNQDFKKKPSLDSENTHNKSQIKEKKSQIKNQPSKSDLDIQTISLEDFAKMNNLWDNIDKQNESSSDNQTIYMLYREILNFQFSAIQQLNHDEVKQYIQSEAESNPDSTYTILLALEKYLKSIDPQIQVIFCNNSTIKTQISMKLISTGFALHKFKCSQKIKKKYHLTSFQQIISNQKDFSYFQTFYQKNLKSKYNIENQNIKITSILKLDNQTLGVQWDTYDPHIVLQNQKACNRIKVSPYFKKFYLSIDDFDDKGDIEFKNKQTIIHFRGHCPYYSPQKCQRFGIKVWDKYDSCNNQWLSMKNQPKQWYSAFFGLFNPTKTNNGKQQNQQQNALISQIKRSLKDTKSLNRDQSVGQGIICTPYMWNALRDTYQISVNGQTYVLVFQCRVNPNTIKITQKQEYWMANRFCDIRPYGIILVNKQLKDNYPKPEDRFKTLFSYKWLTQLKQKDIN